MTEARQDRSSRGGQRRGERLSPEERTRQARFAAIARGLPPEQRRHYRSIPRFPGSYFTALPRRVSSLTEYYLIGRIAAEMVLSRAEWVKLDLAAASADGPGPLPSALAAALASLVNKGLVLERDKLHRTTPELWMEDKAA